MADLLDLSARFIDAAAGDDPTAELGPTNRITLELSEVADGIAVVESFSHVVAFGTDDGLVLFDASLEALGGQVLKALRGWDDDPVHSLVYTHGHVDHVGGARAVIDEAIERGRRRPTVVGHEAVTDRFERYDRTNGYNAEINVRQFGRGAALGTLDPDGRPRFFSDFVAPIDDLPRPDEPRRRRPRLRAAPRQGRDRRPHLDLGARAPSRLRRRPHPVGLPQRREPAEGPALSRTSGPGRYARWPRCVPSCCCPPTACPSAVRTGSNGCSTRPPACSSPWSTQTLDLMNAGATLDTIVHSVRVPDTLLERPYLQPVYDEPEFVVRNIWRLYGGWYDGNPARLKPAPDVLVAAEVVRLAGGSKALAERALEVADGGSDDELRLACQLVEWAAQADPVDGAVAQAAASVYRSRRVAERSLMSRGIYGAAAQRFESDAGS